MARVNRTRRVLARERFRQHTAKWSSERGENVGKRTPSDPMETDCRGKRPSDSPQVSSRET